MPTIADAVRRAGVAVWVMSAVGCYQYTPVSTAPLAGSAVRLDLSASGIASLASALGAGTTSLDGLVVSSADTGFVVADAQ